MNVTVISDVPERETPADTKTMLAALMRHYRKPGAPRDGGVLIPEPAAPGSGRRADLVRIGMTASRGAGIDVHEIKVSRADWLRELDDPEKADAWWPYCTRFWVVAPPGIVQETELPCGWGLMEPLPRGRRFRVVAAAQVKAPELSVPLLIELLRRADNQRLAEIEGLRREHASAEWKIRDEARDEARKAAAAAGVPLDVRERLRLLERLETALGYRLNAYRGFREDPPKRVTPEELAGLITDAGDNLAARRRAEHAEGLREGLRRQAELVIQGLDGESR